MSSVAYLELKRATQSLLDRNLEPTLEAFQHYFPHIVKDELHYASIADLVDWLKHKYIEEQRQMGIEVALVPFQRSETDTAIRKKSRKRAANRVSLSPRNEDTSNDSRRGCNDNGERRAMEVVLGFAHEGECDRECIAMEESKSACEILTAGNNRKMRKISLDSSTGTFPTHESTEEIHIASNKAGDEKLSSESRGNDSNKVLDATVSILPIEKRETHMIASNSTDPLDESVEVAANNLGIQNSAQSQGKFSAEVDTILFPFSVEQRNNKTLRGTLTVSPNDPEAENGVCPVTPADDESSLGSRRVQAADTQDESVKKRKGEEVSNSADAELAQDQQLRKKTKLRIKISKPHMKKKQFDKVSADNSNVNMEAPVKEGPSGISNDCVDIIAELKSTSRGSIYSQNTTEMANDDLLDPSILLRKESAQSTLGTNDSDEQLGTLINNPMLHSEKDEERNTITGSNQQQKSASSISNSPHSELSFKPIHFKKANDREGYLKVKEIIQGMMDEGIQRPASEFYEKYPELSSKYEKGSLSKGIAEIVRSCKTKKVAAEWKEQSISHPQHEAKGRPLIPFTKVNDEEGYMKVKEIIQGMIDEGIQHPASKFYERYPELTSKYEKRSFSHGIAKIVGTCKAKKAAKDWKEQSISHPHDEAKNRLPIPFMKANDEEGYLKVKKIVEGLIDEGNQHPASEFYEKHPELTSKYEKSSLSNGISNFSRRYKAEKNASVGNKESTSTAQDDASKDLQIEDSLEACQDTGTLHVELPVKPIHLKKTNDREGYLKVKEIIEGMVDGGIQHPASEFYERYPELARKYEKSSLSKAISSFSSNYKAKKDALAGSKNLTSTAQDDASIHPHIDDTLKACKDNDTMHVELPFKPIPFKKANDIDGFVKVKEIIEGMIDKGIQHPSSKFYEKYPELTSKYEKSSLSMAISSFSRRYKTEKDALAGNKYLTSTAQDDDTSKHPHIEDSLEACQGNDTLHSELPFKPIHFKKANDKEGYLKVKEIIEGMVDDGVQNPASEFYEKYPELTSKYEKSSLSVGIGSFIHAKKTANSHIEESLKAGQDNDTMHVELPVTPIHFTKANDEEGYMKVKEIIQEMMDEGIQRPASKFYEKYPELSSKYEKSSLVVVIAKFVRSYKTKKAAAEWKEQSISHPQHEAKNRLPIPFTKVNDEEGFMKVKEIIQGMIDEGIQHPASKFYERYPELSSKYEKRSFSHGISSFSSNYKAKKKASVGNEYLTSTAQDDDASNHLHIEDSLKAGQDNDTMSVELPVKPIHFKKANDEEGFMKVKEIIEGMINEGIQYPASEFYKKYPELTSKYEKSSLSMAISHFSTNYKAKKDALAGNKYLTSTAQDDDASKHLHIEDSLKAGQDTGTMHAKLPVKPIHFKKANDEEGFMKVKEIIEGMIDEGIQYPASEFYKRYPELSSKYDRSSLSSGISHFSTNYRAKKYALAGNKYLTSTAQDDDASKHPHIEDSLKASQDTGTMHAKLPVKPIHFKKANDEEGFMKVKEIIEGMINEGIQYPASEFYKRYPELSSKYDRSSLSSGISHFSTNYRAKKYALAGNKYLTSTAQDDDASKHPHIEVKYATLQDEAETQFPCDAEVGKANVSENMSPLKQAKSLAAPVDTDIQPRLNLQNVEIDLDDPAVLAQFVGESELLDANDRQYIPDYIFLSMAQLKSCYVTPLDRSNGAYKSRQIGFKGMCCKHCGGEPGFGRYFPETLRSLSQTTTSQTIVKHIAYKCRKVPKKIQNSVRVLKELQERKDELAKQNQRSRSEERPRGSKKVFFQRLWSRLHEEQTVSGHGHAFDITGENKKPQGMAHCAKKSIEEQDAIVSMMKLATTTTTANSPQRLNSTSTALMNARNVQGDATSSRNSTNIEQIFKPIHFNKANDEVGFLKVKDNIHGMMDEGVEDPQKEFFQKHPSLANKHEKNSMLHVKAKNGLENYCYSLKTSISSPEVEGKIPADDKTKLEGAIEETLQWLDSNLSAEKEEFEEKQKALEAIAAPLLEYLKASETEKSVDNEEPKSTNQCIDKIAASEQSKPIQITELNKFLEDKATSLAEWIFIEIIKFNSANVMLECKEYAEELIKLGFYDKEMMKNFCTVDIVDSEDFTSFMKLAHRLSLKKWLLEHGASK
ncbi:hypothetical protein CTEN210_03779 [Chaetoceros tenuissimus]|uniref:Uncharacterized protein n=1 Tax=Chaetoceros tenuissimus TaxID=426638 RepID=A0AAD3CKF9_9STRA|nr:hypothetical protein CTEN210_03779 [Chaetoceros tenuissimus]